MTCPDIAGVRVAHPAREALLRFALFLTGRPQSDFMVCYTCFVFLVVWKPGVLMWLCPSYF